MDNGYVSQTDLKQALAESEQRIIDDLTEKIRDAQTEILRAFYDWDRPCGRGSATGCKHRTPKLSRDRRERLELHLEAE